MQLINWECLEEMDKLIEQWIKVDAIITDPPYWTTACKWDSVIPFEAMWERLNKLIKPNWAIVLFWSEPFSSALRMSNIKNYKYDWIWDKKKAGNFASVRYQPLKPFEIVSIFNKHYYYPQMTKGKMRQKGGYNSKHEISTVAGLDANINDLYHPKAIIEFTKANNIDSKLHPTQKPVALMEYLIKTYTNEWETVLDFTMWSWTTWVACKNTNRKAIWIELDENYFQIAKERIEKTNK